MNLIYYIYICKIEIQNVRKYFLYKFIFLHFLFNLEKQNQLTFLCFLLYLYFFFILKIVKFYDNDIITRVTALKVIDWIEYKLLLIITRQSSVLIFLFLISSHEEKAIN